jgi:hypothetical protein
LNVPTFSLAKELFFEKSNLKKFQHVFYVLTNNIISAEAAKVLAYGLLFSFSPQKKRKKKGSSVFEALGLSQRKREQ